MCRMLTVSLGLILANWQAVTAGDAPHNQSPDVRAAKASQIAKAWVESLLNGQTVVTTALSDIPFAWDRKETIESLGALEMRLQAVTAQKGARDVRVAKVEVTRDEKSIPTDAAPKDLIIAKAWIGDEAIEVAIKPGDAYRVVGFSD